MCLTKDDLEGYYFKGAYWTLVKFSERERAELDETIITVSRRKQSAVSSCVCDVSSTSIDDASESESDGDDDAAATANDACDALAASAPATVDMATPNPTGRQEAQPTKWRWKTPPELLLLVSLIATEIVRTERIVVT